MLLKWTNGSDASQPYRIQPYFYLIEGCNTQITVTQLSPILQYFSYLSLHHEIQRCGNHTVGKSTASTDYLIEMGKQQVLQ